ncbi:GIY-YIG nuclease family protein, partial [Candidatus Woesebacteria bacterium]|nr:GIY-YIG nuclease family protein [Candidatus Woesebacteria bacterium]
MIQIALKQIPESPGVYIFLKNDTPTYIGKAVNLKGRLRSYFSLNLARKTQKMIKEAEHLSFIKVNSELESLLLEARLIQKYKPKYNWASKDDKHPLYIRITKESYPRVVTARKIEVRDANLAFFGPFPSSKTVGSVLRMLRRIFPYSEHKVAKRPCLYSHMGLCNPCPSLIERQKDEKTKKKLTQIYKKNIGHIKAVLSGKFKSVRNELFDEMLSKSKDEKFEEAQALKEQISRLDYITQKAVPTESFLQNPNLVEEVRRGELAELTDILKKLIPLKGKLSRIECFDISHLAGV